MPFARATGIGSTFDCADHSKSVCFFDSAIISSPVILVSVSVAMSSSLTEPRRHEVPRRSRRRKLFFFVSFPTFVSSWLHLFLLLQHRVTLRLELVARLPL